MGSDSEDCFARRHGSGSDSGMSFRGLTVEATLACVGIGESNAVMDFDKRKSVAGLVAAERSWIDFVDVLEESGSDLVATVGNPDWRGYVTDVRNFAGAWRLGFVRMELGEGL